MTATVASLEIYYELFLSNNANWLETWQEVSGWLVDQKYLKSFWPEIQDGRSSSHVKNIFWTFSSWPKRQIDSKLDWKYQGDL